MLKLIKYTFTKRKILKYISLFSRHQRDDRLSFQSKQVDFYNFFNQTNNL